MIKTTLLVVLLAIFVATIQAANPFDTNNRPFVIGGAFKRVEKKSPSSGFACYNTTLGDWSDYRWPDATVSTSQVSIVQLNNGHTISLMRIGTTNKYGFLYWNLESATILTTTTTVMEAGSNPVLYLSYDQKKLYVGASFTRVGTNSYATEVPLKYRIFSFDISTLPTLAAPSDITSSYGLSTTYALNNPNAVYAVSNGNQLLFAFPGGANPAAFVVFDPASTSWKEIIVTVIRSSSSQFLTMHSGTGELYAKSYDTASPYASSFWKYDSANSNYFVNVKTLGSSTYVTSATEAQAYIASWTVGTGGLYYTVSITNPTFTRFENGMQNIQKVTLTPSPSDPVSLSKTRLTVALDRTSIDTLPISNSISSMYYDENIKQLVVQLTNEGYQVYGPRDSDNTKNKYELTYRLQPVGQLVSYDATTDAFTVPYGGNFAAGVSRFSIYPTVSVTCFGISSYFRTWAPNFAVYDQGKDMFVAENLLSGQIDYDWQNNQPATVTAVENSDDSSVVYVGGYFRTISGTVYNSIVSRTKTGLVALGTGLRIHNFDYNTFDNTPGTVKKLVRSKDNKYLFVLGTFNRAGDLWVNGLAYWNIEKKTWNKLEVNAVEGTINDIDFDGRYLYAVGTITRAGKYVVNNAARFDMDSQTWLPMNDGLSAAAPGGMVIDGKFVALVGAGSGVTFWRSLAVWSSNSWKAVEMDSVSNSGCAADKEVCITDTPTTSMTYFKGKIYFLSGSKVYVSDTSMSKATLYARGNLVVSSGTQFYNYPKSNTIGVATPSGNTFVEYNIDTKNIQHTNTRDAYVIADAAVNVFSAAPKNIFSVVALIVTLIATLFF